MAIKILNSLSNANDYGHIVIGYSNGAGMPDAATQVKIDALVATGISLIDICWADIGVASVGTITLPQPSILPTFGNMTLAGDVSTVGTISMQSFTATPIFSVISLAGTYINYVVDASFGSGTFVADFTTGTGWQKTATQPAGSTVTVDFDTGIKSIGARSVRLSALAGNANQCLARVQDYAIGVNPAIAQNLAFDMYIESANTNVSWNTNSVSAMFRLFMFAMDSSGTNIMNNGSPAYNYMYFPLFGYSSSVVNNNQTLRTAIALDTWVTKTFDVKSWLASNLLSGKTINDWSKLYLQFDILITAQTGKKIACYIDNLRL